jgi:DNA-directed RNA polymerase specialized sigma24 family protein
MHSEEAGKKDETLELLEEYLGQYRRAKRRQRRLEQRLKDIKEDMNSISQGAASFTFRLSDCELRIYEQKEQAEKDLLKIMDIFDYLDKNSDERNALEMYYIDGFKWERVAEELPCSRSQVFNLRETGLKKLLEFSRVREILRKYEAEKIA